MQISALKSAYDLSAKLQPQHSGNVKAVIAVGENRPATASRDQSVAIWERDASQTFELKAVLNGHRAYVNSLAAIPSSNLIASGGNSALILLHSLDTLDSEPTECLIGHSLNVCTLIYSARLQRLVSGSWDHTARIWGTRDERWECELVLDKHDEAVWGVAVVEEGLREGCYLTASADCLIILWDQGGEILMRIKGSPEPVRSLAIIPEGINFASACNDGLIRIWNYSGSTEAVLRGHTDYVYQVTLGAEGHLLSCGEDHTVRVWTDRGVSSDVLLHPCQTVWTVASLPNGDIVSGGSDGGVRVWTRDADRWAEAGARTQYMEEVRKAMRKADPATGTTSSTHGSVDIDISDDKPTIPLSFDLGCDPKTVAQEFGNKHALSDNYIKQIEEFIQTHLPSTEGKTEGKEDDGGVD